jgi:rhodanese-related sulfurtransferase
MLFGLFGKKVNYADLMKQGAVIIDVRTPGEFRSGHIKGSRNMPLDTIGSQVSAIKKLNKPVIVCCKSGMRSGMAKSILAKSGIEVHNGGAWMSLERRIH